MSHFNSKKAMRRNYSIKLHLMVHFKDKTNSILLNTEKKGKKKKAYKKINKTHNIQLGITKKVFFYIFCKYYNTTNMYSL